MWHYAILCALLLASPVLARTSSPNTTPITCEQESDCLAKLPDRARRDGDALTLTLDDGRTKTFTTNKQACMDDDVKNCVIYKLRAYRPAQNVYVLGTTLYESEEAQLVSAKTGEALALPGIPVFSPSERWFAVAPVNGPQEYGFEVGIWSLDKGVAKQQFRNRMADDTPWLQSWLILGFESETRIRFEVYPSFGEIDPKQAIKTDAVLKKRGWVLNRPRNRK